MNDRDYNYIPERRPGFVAVVFISTLTSAAVSIFTVAALMRWGGLGPAFGLMAAGQAAAPVQGEPVGPRTPDVVGMSAEAADELLSGRKLRLVVNERKSHPTVAAGSVISQTPLAQSRMTPGGEVAVVLSTGPAHNQVPDLLGKPLEEAKTALETAGFRVGPIADGESSSAGSGTVMATAPAAGTALDPGTSVALTVARPGIAVPKLLGEHIRKAREEITKAGLAVGEVREIYDEHRRGYLVLTQEPQPGTKVAPGSKVNLVVNQGD